MAANDGLAVFLTVAEARGRAHMAGGLDAVGDLARFALYSYAGERLLSHGWHGWLALSPVLATSYVATRLSTTFARRIKDQHVLDVVEKGEPT